MRAIKILSSDGFQRRTDEADPSADASLLDYMAAHYDAAIIESFGVGGLPSYDDGGDYYRAVAHWIDLGKTVIVTTQVTNEGSNMSVYEVGKRSSVNSACWKLMI